MKTILFFVIAFCFSTFSRVYSQQRDLMPDFSESLINQKLLNSDQGITDDFYGINALPTESSQLKSTSNDWYYLAQSDYFKWSNENSGWECSEKTLYAYDINYKWTVIERQKADGSVPIQKNEYYYYIGDDNDVDEKRTFDYEFSEWILKRQTLYYYDSINNNLELTISKTWDGSEFKNRSKIAYLYDDNKITSYLIQYWVEDNWVNNSQRTYKYDGNKNLIEIYGEAWDDEKSVWVQFSQLFLNYEVETNNLNTMWSQYWDDEDNLWERSLKQTFTYTEDNYQIKTLYEKWDDEGLFWYKSSQTIYYYMLAGSELEKYKNTNLDKPINDFQTTEDDLLINQEKQAALNKSLIGIEVLIDTILHPSVGDLEFTLSHNGISDTLIYREGGDGESFIGTKLTNKGVLNITDGVAPFVSNYKPKNSLSRFIETDPTGTWTLSIYDGVAGNTGVLKSWGLNLIYSSNSTFAIESVKEFPFNIFPNPASSFLILQSSAFILQSSIVEIYDLNGTKLFQKQLPAGSKSIEVDVSSFPNGIYFCKLSTENISVTKKLIIRK